ncbi:MAG TPA: PEP-CTERM sorting domain-containing protein, partial [Edaphobacter sp.]
TLALHPEEVSMSTHRQQINLLAMVVSIAMAHAVIPAHADPITFNALSETALAGPMPGAPLNGKDLAVVIAENGSEAIASVSVNRKKVNPNMDGSWSIGPFGSIKLGTVNVGDPEDLTSLSDTIDIRNGVGSIVITNKDDGFTSDEDSISPAETNEMAKVPNGAATATYRITSPREVPEPAPLALLGIGLIALRAVYHSKKL